MPDFPPFPKILRLSNQYVTITEKIDGTNAQICIEETNIGLLKAKFVYDKFIDTEAKAFYLDVYRIKVGSCKRWIFPNEFESKADNFGFAQWVWENLEEIIKLGPGQHFGEWWGQGIQRNYGLNHKRFSLFGTKRWLNPYLAREYGREYDGEAVDFPTCCDLVPVLSHFKGFDTEQIKVTFDNLKFKGSKAAPGFMEPEGIVIHMNGVLFKKTFENDESKGNE